MPVKKILASYGSETPGTKRNLARFFMHGKLAGSGKLLILAVDQGFEHGPIHSFLTHPAAFDPHYHARLALEGGVSGLAAPLGMIERIVDLCTEEQLPLVLKMNNNTRLLDASEAPDLAVTATVEDALRLGCQAIGFTIYPGSSASLNQFEELREISGEAKAKGLGVIVWSYPRGHLSKAGETALDVICYGAHIACLLGAHLVKVKLPSGFIEVPAAQELYRKTDFPLTVLAERVRHVVQSCFEGQRVVIFSGGEKKETADLLEEARAIHAGGGFGSIIGRNCFQRPYAEALSLLEGICQIYLSEIRP